MSLPGSVYYFFKNRLDSLKEKKFRDSVIQSMIDYYSNSEDKEVKRIVKYYQRGGTSPFPYDLESELKGIQVSVKYEDGLPYVVHNDKKLFFPKEFTEKRVVRMYKGLMAEQLENSPHCYLQNNFEIDNNSILIDVGSADGMFSLDNIHKVSNLYLFESDKKWHTPLKKTFEKWKDKVIIVPMLVSDLNIKDEICSLDSFFKDKLSKNNTVFVKMDVEGYEKKVLEGMQQILQNKDLNLKLAIATYHNQRDFKAFEEYLSNHGLKTNETSGYILFYYDRSISEPYLRKCIIQCEK